MSDMKCPFCKEEIISDVCCVFDKETRDYINGTQIYKCNKCGLFGTKDLWQELIRTRKALDVAKNTFNWIDETYRTGQETEAEIWGKVQLAAQEITALEKSELENLEMLVNNVFK